jgi:TPR repeat protein/putative methionine-R-sulfoxide reductase with GAF domain
MAASLPVVKTAPPNRRRRVRHKIQTPAYATFTTISSGGVLDLHEILNISEEGVAIQCDMQLELGRRINLCLDLAECPDHIYTTGNVIWSATNGCAGLRFAELPPFSLFRLREWLFLNAMSAAASAKDAGVVTLARPELVPPRPSYSDTLAAVTAVQREAETLGTDLSSVLKLIAARAHTLIQASGVAIALADRDPQFVVCRASAGADAPPIGAKLQVGSGFSGECVKNGRLLRCDDAETDSRIDAESCRALGIRSVLAVPLRNVGKTIGMLEAFSPDANAFAENEERVAQRLADTVVAAVNRAARAEATRTEAAQTDGAHVEYVPPLQPAAASPAPQFAPTPGSVLFASQPDQGSENREAESDIANNETSGGISLPRSLLILLVAVAAVIFMVLGYTLAPLIQSRLAHRAPVQMQTVLASTEPPKPASLVARANVDAAPLEQLEQMARAADPAAQYALGRRYATGDGVSPDDREAVNWFTKAAEQGYIPAESKLGSFYYNGRGVPQNFYQAYRWAVLARASGDDTSKTLVPLVARHLTPEQIASIEMDANRWLQQHPGAEPGTGH